MKCLRNLHSLTRMDFEKHSNSEILYPREDLEEKKMVTDGNDPIEEPFLKALSDAAQLSCGLCSMTFVRLCDLTNHKTMHTEEGAHKCHLCEKRFSELDYLKKHVQTHNAEKPFSCSLCYKAFCRLCDLQRHLVTHGGEKPYQCDECDRTFSNFYSVRRHKLMHSGVKPFKCNVCEKVFSHLEYLKKHLVIHTGEKPYYCNVCDKAFARTSALRSHEMIHTGEKPYKCDLCKKSFNQISSMKRHQMLHTGEKPYKCECCGKAFGESDKLKIHLTEHTGNKPFSCSTCQKSFSHLFKLNRHMVTHRNKGPHTCEFCKKSFSDKNKLKIHKIMHKFFLNSSSTRECSRDFTPEPTDETEELHMDVGNDDEKQLFELVQKQELLPYNNNSKAENLEFVRTAIAVIRGKNLSNDGKLWHQKRYSDKYYETSAVKIDLDSGEKRFMCQLCDKMYTRLYDLNRHQVKHTGEKPYKCNSCNKSFTYYASMKRHVAIHSGEKPYSCDSCGKSFSQIEYLKKHMNVHVKARLSLPFATDRIPHKEEMDDGSPLRQKSNYLIGKMKLSKRHERNITFKDKVGQMGKLTTSKNEQPSNESYTCNVCRQIIPQLDDWKIHLTVHGDENRYVCYICETGFRHHCDLINHIVDHYHGEL